MILGNTTPSCITAQPQLLGTHLEKIQFIINELISALDKRGKVALGAEPAKVFIIAVNSHA